MKQPPRIADNFEHAISIAAKKMSVTKNEWLQHGEILKLMKQKTLSDFF